MADKSGPFWTHLEELRRRLFRVAFVFIALTFVAFWQYDKILVFFLAPVSSILPPDSSFIATSAVTGWVAAGKVALFAAFFITFPYTIAEIWFFLRPGLKKNERRGAVPVLILLMLFFIVGGIFGYKLVMPITLKFLIGIYDGSFIRYLPDIDVTLTFVMRIIFAFGLLFETPFLLLALGASGLVSHAQMSKARPTMIVIAFIVAAILTPPDVVSQLTLAVPFCVLYELGMAFVKISDLLKRRVG